MKPREIVAFAGLLHDIGKVMQRAELPCRLLADALAKQRLCPRSGPGSSYSHLHVLWTADFLESGRLPLDTVASAGAPDDTVANLAACHHLPSTPLQHLIAQADCMSAGMDRAARAEDEGPGSSDRHKRARLRSVFASIDIGKGDPNAIGQRTWTHNLMPLELSKEAIFPVPEDPEVSLVDKYADLWGRFAEEANRWDVRAPRPDLLYQRLDWLSYKYFWCVPSSTVDDPDISLYDHARTTAALATALFDYHAATDSLTVKEVTDRKAQKFRFLSGDLSGIQRALFNFEPGHNRSVAKMLRAKSFYLGAVLDAVLELLGEELDLHRAQTVLHAGGRFLAVLPNIPGVEEKLPAVRELADEWTLERFDGQVSIILDWSVTASPEDFCDKGFKTVWGRIGESLEQAKSRKLLGALQDRSLLTWKPVQTFVLSGKYESYGQTGKCASCGQEPAQEPGGEGARCREMRDLGTSLVRDPVLVWNRAGRGLRFFGGRVGLELMRRAGFELGRVAADVSRVEEINCLDATVSCRLLANYVPRFDSQQDEWLRATLKDDLADVHAGDALPLSAIALRGRRNGRGVSMLGILKGDVDHLGSVLSAGLPDNRFSISRLAELSRMLDLFFSGYLGNLATAEFPNVYTVYAGGDDLLVVSDWESTMHLAHRLEVDFRRFVCANPNVTISAGLALTHDRFPVRLGAARAEQQLEQAKDAGRARFSLLGGVVEWPVFEERLQPFAEKLKTWLDAGIINTAFLYRLLRYHRMHRAVKADPTQAVYRALMAYDIRRNLAEKQPTGVSEREVKEAVGELSRLFDLRTQDAVLMDALCVPVQWALYATRRREA